MKLFFRWAHLSQSPAAPGPNGVCGLSLSGAGMAGRGRPPFRPAGDPVAQSAACVRPTVSPPVRRPDVRGCGPSSVVGRQFRRFGRACQAPASKPAAQGRTAFMGSCCSSALSGRRGSGEIRFMVGGGRPKADHVGFWDEKRRCRWSKVMPTLCSPLKAASNAVHRLEGLQPPPLQRTWDVPADHPFIDRYCHFVSCREIRRC